MPTSFGKSGRLTIEGPAEVIGAIETSAAEHGLRVSTYLMMLHQIHVQGIDPRILDDVRETFGHDAEILRELAQ
ncbi:hypothetical protein Pan216_47600 [Planctomycetes bacterium Pan216]|uniref:Uncharacterized protein n=1 Tax=Kolteria novifilia TaxID=2527975 RepID=A0A518BA80_9BACT|nr:hypothetical protein Pan216_47600 [Planctomycetes bacterium Pan216]